MNVIAEINGAVAQTSPLMYQLTALSGSFLSAIEFVISPRLYREMKEAIEKMIRMQLRSRKKLLETFIKELQ